MRSFSHQTIAESPPGSTSMSSPASCSSLGSAVAARSSGLERPPSPVWPAVRPPAAHAATAATATPAASVGLATTAAAALARGGKGIRREPRDAPSVHSCASPSPSAPAHPAVGAEGGTPRPAVGPGAWASHSPLSPPSPAQAPPVPALRAMPRAPAAPPAHTTPPARASDAEAGSHPGKGGSEEQLPSGAGARPRRSSHGRVSYAEPKLGYVPGSLLQATKLGGGGWNRCRRGSLQRFPCHRLLARVWHCVPARPYPRVRVCPSTSLSATGAHTQWRTPVTPHAHAGRATSVCVGIHWEGQKQEANSLARA